MKNFTNISPEEVAEHEALQTMEAFLSQTITTRTAILSMAKAIEKIPTPQQSDGQNDSRLMAIVLAGEFQGRARKECKNLFVPNNNGEAKRLHRALVRATGNPTPCH